jgi:hypothetical protein
VDKCMASSMLLVVASGPGISLKEVTAWASLMEARMGCPRDNFLDRCFQVIAEAQGNKSA